MAHPKGQEPVWRELFMWTGSLRGEFFQVRFPNSRGDGPGGAPRKPLLPTRQAPEQGPWFLAGPCGSLFCVLVFFFFFGHTLGIGRFLG